MPVYIANDANGAALAELYKGAFVGCKTAVLFTLGTGLGGGIILDGRCSTAAESRRCELGHMYLVEGGEALHLRQSRLHEAYCAASALAREGGAMQAHPESMLAEKSGGDAARLTRACDRLCQGGRPGGEGGL